MTVNGGTGVAATISFHYPLHRFIAAIAQRCCTTDGGGAILLELQSELARRAYVNQQPVAASDQEAWRLTVDHVPREIEIWSLIHVVSLVRLVLRPVTPNRPLRADERNGIELACMPCQPDGETGEGQGPLMDVDAAVDMGDGAVMPLPRIECGPLLDELER